VDLTRVCSPAAMDLLLRYLYLGRMDGLEEQVEGLLHCALLFQLIELKVGHSNNHLIEPMFNRPFVSKRFVVQ
jgi:hypothetical protein